MYENLIIEQNEEMVIIDVRDLEEIEIELIKQDNLNQKVQLLSSLDKIYWSRYYDVVNGVINPDKIYQDYDYKFHKSGKYDLCCLNLCYLKIIKENKTDSSFEVSITKALTPCDIEMQNLYNKVHESIEFLEECGYTVNKNNK